jgi:FkbM family methyltransferase
METLKQPFRALRRRIYEQLGNPKYSRPSLHDLDQKLAKYLNYSDGFFIEVGANNGYNQSNTYFLERMLNWHGVLVEAIPDLYQQCKRERRQSSVYNYALVANDYTKPVIEMHFVDVMSVVEGALKTPEAQADHIQTGLEVTKLKQTYRLQVPTRTLESILDELPDLPEIDFFSLDVEGYELNVLHGLNLRKYRPKYILVEARYFDEVNEFLSDSYDLIEQMSYHDYLYRLKTL